MKNEIIGKLRESVLTYDGDAAKNAASQAVEKGLDAYTMIQEGLAPAIREVGEKFDRSEIFLPHLTMAADAMEEAVKVLEQHISSEQKLLIEKGTIVLGTVRGDVHNIGKNIVGMMAKAAGFKVVDIGVDAHVTKFVEAAESQSANIIAASALMTYTMNEIKTLVEYLNDNGIRDKYKVICGGGALSEQWAQDAGADGYAADAVKAVELVQNLLAKN